MGPGSGLALDGGGARAVVLTLGSVLNVKQLLLKSLLLFLLNVKTQKQCFSVNVEQLYPPCPYIMNVHDIDQTHKPA